MVKITIIWEKSENILTNSCNGGSILSEGRSEINKIKIKTTGQDMNEQRKNMGHISRRGPNIKGGIYYDYEKTNHVSFGGHYCIFAA